MSKLILILFTIVYSLFFLGFSGFAMTLFATREASLGIVLLIFALIFFALIFIVDFITIRRLTKKGQNKKFQKLFLKELVAYLRIIQKNQQQTN